MRGRLARMARLVLAGDWLVTMRSRIGGGHGPRTTIRASGHRTLSAALGAAGTHPSVLDLDEGALLRVDVPLLSANELRAGPGNPTAGKR
jgi:N-dimethylarginine dimethylaminohydrolase